MSPFKGYSCQGPMDSSEILSRSQTKTYILGQENLEDTQFSKNLQV